MRRSHEIEFWPTFVIFILTVTAFAVLMRWQNPAPTPKQIDSAIYSIEVHK